MNAGLQKYTVNKFMQLIKLLQSNSKAPVKKQTYQMVDTIPEGRGANSHQA